MLNAIAVNFMLPPYNPKLDKGKALVSFGMMLYGL